MAIDINEMHTVYKQNDNLIKQVQRLKLLLADCANHLSYMAAHSDWTPAEVAGWVRGIDKALEETQ